VSIWAGGSAFSIQFKIIFKRPVANGAKLLDWTEVGSIQLSGEQAHTSLVPVAEAKAVAIFFFVLIKLLFSRKSSFVT
jgi:hypothetical protein